MSMTEDGREIKKWGSGSDHFPCVIGDLSLVIDGAIHCAMTNDKWKTTNEKSFPPPIHPFIFTGIAHVPKHTTNHENRESWVLGLFP
jgi:hypothetical protein